MTTKELNRIREFSIFVVKLYIKPWFGCTNAIKSANQDLNFVRDAIKFAETDQVVSRAVIEKFQNHFWYLTPQTVGMAFFDEDVSIEIKRKMVNRLKATDPIVNFHDYRKHANLKELLNFDLSDFVSHKTNFLFTSFDIETDFFKRRSIHMGTQFAISSCI